MSIKRSFLSASAIFYTSMAFAMAPDSTILDRIETVTQSTGVDVNGWNLQTWKGLLPSGLIIQAVEFSDGPLQGRVILTKPATLRGNFITEQSEREALEYFKRKYEVQSPGYRWTQ